MLASDKAYQAYDWRMEDVDEQFEIRAWCLDQDSKPALIRFKGFSPCAYLVLPASVKWHSQDQIRLVIEAINARTHYAIKDWQIAKNKQTLYYYQAKRITPAVLLEFKNARAMRTCANLLEKPLEVKRLVNYPISLLLCEDKVPSFLKMLRAKQTDICQWFKLREAQPPLNRQSTLEQELEVYWENLQPLPVEETISYSTRPGILSFDIETYSHVHTKFPDQDDILDPVIMYSATYKRYLEPEETAQRFLLVVGEVKLPAELQAEVISCRNETDLILKSAELMRHLDPEVVIGYNIFGFDWGYLNNRLELDPNVGGWPACSRLQGVTSKYYAKSWASSAYARVNIEYLDMEGRINLDVMTVIKRDYKFPKYTLDYVAKEFLGGTHGKVEIGDAKAIFKAYQDLQQSAQAYFSQLANQPVSQAPWLDWPQHEEMMANLTTCPESLQTSYQTYLQAREAYSKIGHYAVVDSIRPLQIFEKINAWENVLELASIVKITPLQTYTKGQGQRGFCQIYVEASNNGYILNQVPAPEKNYVGGYVMDPMVGLHDDVMCLDFSSLYPSIIIANNLCYTTYIQPADVHNYSPSDYTTLEWTDQTKQGKTIHHKHHFKKREVETVTIEKDGRVITETKIIKEGLLPRLCRHLISERQRVRNLQKGLDPNSTYYIILESRQKALKVSANSVYGCLGATVGMVPLPEVAESVTYIGRLAIQTCNQYLIKHHQATIIYGDTDSTMFKKPGVSGLALATEGPAIAEELSKLFEKPMKLEYEKGGRIFCITKKKYVFWRYNKAGKLDLNSSYILNRGIILARRDNCLWQRTVYQDVINRILTRQSLVTTFEAIIEHLKDLIRGAVSWEDLLIIKKMGDNYKSASAPMKVFGNRSAQEGRPISSGERVDYIVVQPHNPEDAKLLGNMKRMPVQYLEGLESDQPERYNRLYYLENIICNAVEQIFQIAYQPLLTEIEEDWAQRDFLRFLYACQDVCLAKGYSEVIPQVLSLDSNQDKITYLTQQARGRTHFRQLKTKYLGPARQKNLFRVTRYPVQCMIKQFKKQLTVVNQLRATAELTSRILPQLSFDQALRYVAMSNVAACQAIHQRLEANQNPNYTLHGLKLVEAAGDVLEQEVELQTDNQYVVYQTHHQGL